MDPVSRPTGTGPIAFTPPPATVMASAKDVLPEVSAAPRPKPTVPPVVAVDPAPDYGEFPAPPPLDGLHASHEAHPELGKGITGAAASLPGSSGRWGRSIEPPTKADEPVAQGQLGFTAPSASLTSLTGRGPREGS